MNENLNLVEILKDCPKGTKLYSIIYGEVEFNRIEKRNIYSIIFVTKGGNESTVTSDGKHYNYCDGDCTLFPSKEQRDWSKFHAPWLKKSKFDPKTLKAFERVLIFNYAYKCWTCDFYSSVIKEYVGKDGEFPYVCVGDASDKIIPYNDDTKHLVDTSDEAPEYYRYWED